MGSVGLHRIATLLSLIGVPWGSIALITDHSLLVPYCLLQAACAAYSFAFDAAKKGL